MKLYHYTARHHYEGGDAHAGPGILHRGLLPNIHPYIDLRGGMVWLTDSEEWQQSWSTGSVPGVDCDRTEVRVEVVIPKADRFRLKPWREVRWRVITDGMRRDLEEYGDPDRWFVYVGRIPPAWIRGIESRDKVAA